MSERELLEERRSRPVEKRTAETFAASHDVNESALMERLEDRASTNAANLFDLRSADRLSVSNYRERLERRCREALRPRGELRSLDRFRVFRARENLPAPSNFDQLDAVAIVVVVIMKLRKRGFESRLAVICVRRHGAERIYGNRNRAREERGLKQLR
jgi:hypothetical protein